MMTLKPRSSVRLGKMLRICSGGRHAWFDSNVGVIRKPLPSRFNP
jgi:hypothetical protein